MNALFSEGIENFFGFLNGVVRSEEFFYFFLIYFLAHRFVHEVIFFVIEVSAEEAVFAAFEIFTEGAIEGILAVGCVHTVVAVFDVETFVEEFTIVHIIRIHDISRRLN